MSIFDQIFSDLPIGSTVAQWWAGQDNDALLGAAEIIAQEGANPWVFSGDCRHFEQFAGEKENSALSKMTSDQFRAIAGHWAL